MIYKRELFKRINTISKNLTDNRTFIESILPPIVGRAYGLIVGSKNKTDLQIQNSNSTKRIKLAQNDMNNLEPIKRKRKFKIDTDKLNTPNLGRSFQAKKTKTSNARKIRPTIRLDELNSKDPFGFKKNGFGSEEQEDHCYQLIELTTLPIRIVSPNYHKGNYPPNSNCIYNLTSAETTYEQQIKLNIINLDLEDSKKCEHDYLQILNSSIRFCGELKNKVFYLNQSSAILNFRSDITTEFKGFDIELSVESNNCKSLITLDHYEHIITSPNYPNNYPDSMNCWTLINGENLQLEHNAQNPGYDDQLSISFKFIELDMEPDSLCNIDYVELFEVNEDLEPRASLGRFCEYGKYVRIVGDKANKKNQLITMGNQIQTRNPYLYLHFKTDKLINSRGFKAKIEIKEKVSNKLNHTCDWHADSINKKIISPLFPHPYPSNIDCSVLIEAPKNDQFILLTFERFILEPGNYEYIQNDIINLIETFFLNFYHFLKSTIDANCTFDRFLIYEPLPQKRRKRSPIGNQRTNSDNLDLRRFLIGNQVIRTSKKDSEILTNQTKKSELITKSNQQLKSKDLLTKTLEQDKPSEIYCGKKEPNSKYVSKGSKLVLRFVTDDFGEYLGFSINYKFIDKEDVKKLKDQSDDKLEEKKKDTVEYEFEPTDANVTIGSSHILKCKPKGYSKLNLINNQFNQNNQTTEKIRWFKDNDEITDDLNEDKTVLLIREFHLSSTGSYKCKFGKSSRQAWLKIKNEKECNNEILFQRRPQDQVTTEGDYPILECNAVSLSKNSKLRTTWLHNGKPIRLDQRIQLLPNNYLLLGEIKKEDSGYYHCQITDEQNDKCQKTSISFVQVRSKQNLEKFCGISFLNKNKKESVQHHAKIVGGTEAIRGQYPWQVMFSDQKRGSFCGGALLSEKWIATAAHCFKPNPNSAPSPPTSQITVRLGN